MGLGAAMWMEPHVVILDEPTNFLDRDSLGALATAIKNYEGGVIIISHQREFYSALCPEVWSVVDGRCTVSGSEWMEAAEKARKKADKEAAKGKSLDADEKLTPSATRSRRRRPRRRSPSRSSRRSRSRSPRCASRARRSTPTRRS